MTYVLHPLPSDAAIDDADDAYQWHQRRLQEYRSLPTLAQRAGQGREEERRCQQ